MFDEFTTATGGLPKRQVRMSSIDDVLIIGHDFDPQGTSNIARGFLKRQREQHRIDSLLKAQGTQLALLDTRIAQVEEGREYESYDSGGGSWKTFRVFLENGFYACFGNSSDNVLVDDYHFAKYLRLWKLELAKQAHTRTDV